MAPSPLARKLQLKPGHRAGLVDAPPGYRELLEPLPDGATLTEAAARDLDWILVFAENAVDAERTVPAAAAATKPDGLLWVAYRKGGKKAGTDLNRDILWELMGRFERTGVTLVALDDRWSAMRFRPPDQVGR